MSRWWIALLLLTAACGGAPAPAAGEAAEEATAGAEVEEVVEEVAEGPTRSYVAEHHTAVMRVDLVRVRESSISDDIASLVRSYPTWQELLGGSGIDPVRDFDRVLVSGARSVTGPATMLIRHHLTNERIREAVLNVAVENERRPEWRTVDGFDVADWPAPTQTPRVVIIAAEHELVVTTPEGLEEAIAVAHDHRLRRSGDELVEPALTLDEGVIATVVAQELSERSMRRLRYPPDSFELTLADNLEEEGQMVIRAHAVYPNAAGAEQARLYFARQRDFYAGQMLVRAVGLDRPLREATIETEEERLDVNASFTDEEAQRVLSLIALGQLGG